MTYDIVMTVHPNRTHQYRFDVTRDGVSKMSRWSKYPKKPGYLLKWVNKLNEAKERKATANVRK
jgi:hypothetical protein